MVDTMRNPVGKPGSPERIEALHAHYKKHPNGPSPFNCDIAQQLSNTFMAMERRLQSRNRMEPLSIEGLES